MTTDETLAAWVKANRELITSAFDSATRYSNLFILAGYGTFFGLWNVTRDRLVGRQAPIWAALLMLVSVATFAAFQVYSVYLNSSALIRLAQANVDPPPATLEDLMSRMQRHYEEERKRTPRTLRIWRPVFFFTVATGFAAIGILGWAFVQSLWRGLVPFFSS